MNESLFKGKYRIKSARLPSWDYSSAGFYFVTICTKGMGEFFGEIKIIYNCVLDTHCDFEKLIAKLITIAYVMQKFA